MAGLGLLVLALTACAAPAPTSTLASTPVPTPTVNWGAVGREIMRETDGVVLSVWYDPTDDFLTVTVRDDTSPEIAATLSCETILPSLDAVGSFALFAVYSASGEILTSWNRCLPPPSPPPSPSSPPPSA